MERSRPVRIETADAGFFTVDMLHTRLHGRDAEAAEQFRSTGAIRSPDALAPGLLARLQAIADTAPFRSDAVEGLGHRGIEQPPTAGNVLSLALKRAPLLRWLERVTGCGDIAGVEGRVTRFQPGSADRLGWHDDRKPGRRLAITVALGRASYRGGLFELRRKGHDEPLVRHRHDVAGTALIFTVDAAFEHRVTAVLSGTSRRVYAGWFLAPSA